MAKCSHENRTKIDKITQYKLYEFRFWYTARTIHIESIYFAPKLWKRWSGNVRTFNYCYIWMFESIWKPNIKSAPKSKCVYSSDRFTGDESNETSSPLIYWTLQKNEFDKIVSAVLKLKRNKKPFLITLLRKIIDFRTIRLRSKDSSVLEWYAFHCGCLLHSNAPSLHRFIDASIHRYNHNKWNEQRWWCLRRKIFYKNIFVVTKDFFFSSNCFSPILRPHSS